MFIKLEKSITELHDMFLDIAMLIENQVYIELIQILFDCYFKYKNPEFENSVSRPGLGNVRPAKHLNVGRELNLKFSK